MRISRLPFFIVTASLGFLLLAFCISCEYEPVETRVNNITAPIEPVVTVDLPFTKDTVLINGWATVNFSFKVPGHHINTVNFTMNGRNLYASGGDSSVNGSVAIDYRFFNDGTYKLTLTAIIKSNSGSIADKLNKEVYNYTKSWTIIYSRLAGKPELASISPGEGRMRIYWKRSQSSSFQEYEIIKSYYSNTSKRYYFEQVATITDISQSSYVDSTILGGVVKYLVCSKEGFDYAYSDTLIYNGQNTELTIANDNAFNCTLSWNKSIFYANFGRINILSAVYDNSGYLIRIDTLFSLTSIGDTLVSIIDGIRTKRRFIFEMIPKTTKWNVISSQGIKIEKFHFSSSEPFLKSNQLCFSSVYPYTIYGRTSDSIFRYSSSDNSIYKAKFSDNYGLTVSQNNKFLMCGNYRLNPITLQAQNLYIKQGLDLFGTFDWVSLSDNGRYTLNTSYNERLVYDIDGNQNIQSFPYIAYIYSRPKISPDGQFIVMVNDNFHQLEIWKYYTDSGKFKLIHSEEGNYAHRQFTFEPDTTKSNFYISNGNSIEEWSCETMTKIRSFQTDATDILQIDPVSGNIISYKYGHIFINDPADMSVIWDVPVDKDCIEDWLFHYPGKFVVINSTIYLDGRKFNLNNYEKLN